MPTIDHAQKRVAAVLEEIDRLKESEFPYAHPHDALAILASLFSHQEDVLRKVSPTAAPDVTGTVSCASLYYLRVYVPILGFILRSTNVRNAFEVYGPLLRLARSILSTDTKLIVSSEWDYSPVVYRSMTDLPGFVLIGLPAPESANPLLVPLAGHELGHSVWKAEGFSADFAKTIEDRVLTELTTKRWDEYNTLHPQYTKDHLRAGDLFARATWMPAYTWALLQAEEIFCDFLGLRLFAEAYLYAFEYLTSPGTSGQRSLRYPSITHRVSHLVAAADAMEVAVHHEFESGFQLETEPVEPAAKLLVSTADAVSASLVPDLIKSAQDFAANKDVPTRNRGKVSDICDEFRRMITPTSAPQQLTDICNAGWNCFLDPNLWKDVPQIRATDKDRVLKDILLKSMEVSEIHERLRKPL